MKKATLFLILQIFTISLFAQINTDRVLAIGRNALYFEDYVLSIQYFNQVIKSKPWLAEPYFYRAVAKINLDDFKGAEEDCTLCLQRNPFLTQAYYARGIARQSQEKYDEAIDDYQKGLEFKPEDRQMLVNMAVAFIQKNKLDYILAVKVVDSVEEAIAHIAAHSTGHSEAILTFTGLDGKLLALKPDVTLSIVKNTKGSRDTAERVYYNENVYRARKGAGEYKEIMQVGLEYIGEVDAYATLEVLLLAQKSLKAISDAYILDVSHMGFVAGLMEEVALPYAQQDRILDCISEKNIHGIRAVCKENSVAADLTERLEGLASLYGSLEETLPQAKALCCNEKMEQAVQELENILRCLKIGGNEQKVNLDFSIVNDMDYYTGIIFQGFINGVPSSILSGGRYDNLLRKLCDE